MSSDECFYADLREKAAAKRRPAESNGQRRAALARWNAHKQALAATTDAIYAQEEGVSVEAMMAEVFGPLDS